MQQYKYSHKLLQQILMPMYYQYLKLIYNSCSTVDIEMKFLTLVLIENEPFSKKKEKKRKLYQRGCRFAMMSTQSSLNILMKRSPLSFINANNNSCHNVLSLSLSPYHQTPLKNNEKINVRKRQHEKHCKGFFSSLYLSLFSARTHK